MNDSVKKVKAITVIIIALLIYGGPIYYLTFSCFIAYQAGGISEVSLGLSEELGWVVKAVSLLGTLSMFSVGFMKSKFRLDGKLDEEESKKLNIGIYFTIFTMGFSAFLFSAANGWLSPIGIEPLKVFNQSGWNSLVTVFSIVLIPSADYFAGVLSLQYMNDVYPDLAAAGSSSPDPKHKHKKKLSDDAANVLQRMNDLIGMSDDDVVKTLLTKDAVYKEKNKLLGFDKNTFANFPDDLAKFTILQGKLRTKLESVIKNAVFP